MKRRVVLGLVVWLCVVCFFSVAQAEVQFKFGASERIRQEIWDNLIDLKTLPVTPPDFSFFRFKTSLWGSAEFNPDTMVYLKLTSEVYYYLFGPRQYPKIGGGWTRLDENEGVVDNLYIKANNVFGLPLDLKIGRQDFFPTDIYGEGFLFSDGTPQDGSRTFYFNAAKATWKFNEKHKVDLVYITNQFQDTYLPTWRTHIHDSLTYYNNRKILDASDSQAFVVYGRNTLTDTLYIEPYYVYKREEETPIVQKIPELNLNTVGMRAIHTYAPWTFGGEFAYQFGEYKDDKKGVSVFSGQDRRGFGGYIFGKRKYADMKLKPEFELRFVYLSGDDPATGTNENFNPLYSRQPYWNELLGYVMINEFIRDVAKIAFYWSNAQLYMAKVTMELSPATKLALSYQYWRANEIAQPIASLRPMFGDGRERGHLPTLFLTHKFNKHINGFFQYEYFIPGNFYADKAACGQFLRWNIQFTI